MHPFSRELKQQIEGEVLFDPITRQVYSVDASIFEIEPVGVVIPKTQADLVKIVQIATRYHVPLIARGAATGITGGCLGRGLIVDVSKYLTNILEVNLGQEFVTCEPGVIQDTLNAQLDPYHYRLGPDTSTGNRATLGGMLANNAAGSHSLRYGRMVDHVHSVELLLANGENILFSPLTKEEWERKRELSTCEGHIYREIWRIRETYKDEIAKRFPPIPRRVSGYNLDELIKTDSINLAKLITGSEGTLGIATKMTLKITPKAKTSGLCLLHFKEMLNAMHFVPQLLTYSPMALEMLDDQIIELGRSSPSLRGQLDWLKGHPKALLIVELEGENQEEIEEKLSCFAQEAKNRQMGYAQTVILNPTEMAKVWKLRKAGLGILLSKRTWSRAIAFLEDISVHPSQLTPFMERFLDYLKSKNKVAGIYGHVGSGCLHIRPYINLSKPEELALMKQMMLDVSDLLLKYGGALSGEHGDGLIRSWLNPKMFGEKITQAFVEIKRAFDPYHLMNPGKITLAEEPFAPLRSSPQQHIEAPSTFLNFKPEGGFALAVDLCNGNGLCRKKEDLMCPSFQATHEEFHSTRARAQALRAVIHGHLPISEFTSPRMHEVMDLCISCKGCKTECPSQVDMAKMKAEFLYHYQKQHGTSMRSYLLGHIGLINRWTSPFARLFNPLIQTERFKQFLNYLGIASERSLPPLATSRFSKWLKYYSQPKSKKQIVLFNDTFNEFNEPQIGQAAIKILNALDYEVIVPRWTCCGRPLISKGLLKQAKQQAKKVIQTLYSLRLPIIGLEPSCILTIKDDYLSLLPEFPIYQIQELTSRCFTLDEFLASLVDEGAFILPFGEQNQEVKVHGHCHQKALVGMAPTLKVLNAISGLKGSEIRSGCCGMAGSFGYEKEHYDVSMKIGELNLFPAIRRHPEALFIANGISCRHQILDGTGQRAYHLAEAIDQMLL